MSFRLRQIQMEISVIQFYGEKILLQWQIFSIILRFTKSKLLLGRVAEAYHCDFFPSVL